MKRKWLGLALAAAMAFAGTAWADILAQDSAANYSEEYPFVAGSCGGSGFAGWEFPDAQATLADSAAGQCGDINSANGMSFRVARDGDHDWCHIYREFDELIPGNTMTLKFTCAWDGGGRGIDLYAGGDQIANAVNLGPGNKLSVNEEIISEDYASKAVYEIAFVQADDGIELALKRTAEGAEEPFTYSTKISTSKKLSRIGFYAGGWDWSGGENVENYALFVNDLKIEGIPPADRLTLKGEWAVTQKTADLGFTVNRQNNEGDLVVSLESSYPEFASVPETVTIQDGEWSAEFTVTATLQGSANAATISASAEGEGIVGDAFDIRGPKYSMSVAAEQVAAETEYSFWVDCDDLSVRDDSKLELVIDPAGAVDATAPADWVWQDKDNGAYVEAKFTAHEAGKMILKFDGVEFASKDISIIEAGATLSGPTSIRTGTTVTYTADITLGAFEEATFRLEASPADIVTIEPAAKSVTESGPISFQVTAGDETGTVTLTLKDEDGIADTADPITATITEAPDYSDYIAYDDASFYGDGFDYAAVGEGTDKFQPWVEVFNNNAPDRGYYAGAIIVGNAPDEAALTDGKAFALYSNGGEGDDRAEIRIRRPFVNALSAGQEFSVQMSPNYRDGAKGIVLQGEWEGNWYDRVEFYCSGDVYAYKINGGEPVVLPWAYGTKLIDMSLMYEADGSSYTLVFSRVDDEDVVVEGLTFEGTVDGALFYSWNGGEGDENNFVFNSLAIEQVEEPVPPTPPTAYLEWTAGVWNPDEVGVAYTFGLKSSQDGAIGLVDLEATEGLVLSVDQIDLTAGEATFTATLSGEELVPGTTYTITAKAQAEGISDATYGLTATEPSCSITPQYATFDYVSGGTVEFEITGTPSRIGVTVDLDSDNPNILAPPSPATAVVGGKFTYTMAGVEEGETYIHATHKEGEMTYEWGYAGITINGTAPGDEGPSIDETTVVEVKFSNGFSGEATEKLQADYQNVKAQRLEWNGSRDSGFEPVGEVLLNQAEWPEMKFDLDDPKATLQFIFIEKE